MASVIDAGVVSRHLAWLVSGLCDHDGSSVSPIPARDPSSFHVPDGMSRARRSAYVSAVVDAMCAYEELRFAAEPMILQEIRAAFAHEDEKSVRARAAAAASFVSSYVLPRSQLCKARFVFFRRGTSGDVAAAMCLAGAEGIAAARRAGLEAVEERAVFEASRERASAAADAFDSVVFGGADASRLISREPGSILESLTFRSAAGGDAPGPVGPYRELSGDPSLRVFLRGILRHVTLRFAVKVSFVADEEESSAPSGGRTRARPSPWAVLRGLPHEFYVPWPFKEPELSERFVEAAERLSEAAISVDTPYLLPNATCIRAVDVADMHSFVERANDSLCLRSCQETWWKAKEETAAVAAADPASAPMFGPPCLHASRAGARNPCPHKGSYCGVQAWRDDRSLAARRL